ncbi:MAG: DDE transposase, partial [Deltaproteobacteria bacterium]|nr:DDE transposase [Deltaproteobacteria bacterium]
MFPENVRTHLSLDEVTISQGSLYTLLPHKAYHGPQGALVAIVRGTKTAVVSEALHRIPHPLRETVQPMPCDLNEGMAQIATAGFPQ